MIGITPACAGQIKRFRTEICKGWDHPRLRGTNLVTETEQRIQMGSPPLARDKCTNMLSERQKTGITPACAGQIVFSIVQMNKNRDHPRLRGTNCRKFPHLYLCVGSPPLARDKLLASMSDYFSARITPACAGQMLLIWLQTKEHRDHPRLRGTNK